jgi:hypothetical protein
MKAIILMSLVLVMLGLSCAQDVDNGDQPLKKERAIKTESALIQEGYTLSTVIEAVKPIAEHVYILAKNGETELKIRDTEGFAQVVRKISSQEQALELVRLLTSQEFRPFLKDIYYSEVHKKENEEDRWFAIEPKQYDEWKLHEPVVTEENDVYKIERFVACYPRLLENKEITQAKLVKIWEWVDSDGKYLAEIQDVIAEGDAIHKILIFTK